MSNLVLLVHVRAPATFRSTGTSPPRKLTDARSAYFRILTFLVFFSKLVLQIRVTGSKAQGKCGRLGATSRLYWLDSYDYQRQLVVIYGRV